MEVEIIPVPTAILNELLGTPEAIHTINKRHRFSPKDKIYLEQQFSVNPYSSTEDRAQTLSAWVSQKKIFFFTQTWFNKCKTTTKCSKDDIHFKIECSSFERGVGETDICTTHLEITF